MKFRSDEIKEELAQLEYKDINKKIELLIKLSHQNWETGHLKEAWKNAQEAQYLSEEINLNSGIAKAHGCKAKINYSSNKIEQALEEGYLALSIFRKLKDKKGMSSTLNNIGVFNSALGMKDRAFDCYRQSYEYNPDNPFAINNMGEIYENQGDLDKALESYLKTREFAVKNNLDRVLCLVQLNLGNIYTKFQRFDEAIEMFNKALDVSIQRDLHYDYININLGMGKIFLSKKNYQKAEDFFNKALTRAEEINNDEYRNFCYSELINLYKVSDNVLLLNKFLELQLEVSKNLYSSNVTQKLVELETAFRLEKKDMESRKMMEQSAKLASIGVMAAGITHEINQPLNAIKVSAESILFWDKRNKGVIPELFIKELKNISKGAARIDEIIQHMRSFWIDPEVHLNEQADLNEAVENGLSLLKRQISAHGINLRSYLAPEKMMVKADFIYLEQIVINLVTNAISALDKSEKKEKYLAILTSKSEDKIYLVIRDNGIGISTEIIEQLYNPFYSTSQPGEGMGLGLAIVKHYLERCSGHILAENNDEGGATFRLSFLI